MVMSTATDKEANKPVVNNYTAPASKPTSKQPKGIMGMFANKATPKSEEQSREVKMEQADDPSPVSEQFRHTHLKTSSGSVTLFYYTDHFNCTVWPLPVDTNLWC